MFRTLTIARRRRHWSPPPAATHVFTFVPPWLLDPPPADPDEGMWELQALDDFLAGTPGRSAVTFDGPSDLPMDVLRRFAEDEICLYLTLARFGYEVEDGDRAETVPAYWIGPA